MTLVSGQRAYLTARVGAARVGAVRVGFTPEYTQGLTPGSLGGFYVWRQADPAAFVWTAVKR